MTCTMCISMLVDIKIGHIDELLDSKQNIHKFEEKGPILTYFKHPFFALPVDCHIHQFGRWSYTLQKPNFLYVGIVIGQGLYINSEDGPIHPKILTGNREAIEIEA